MALPIYTKAKRFCDKVRQTRDYLDEIQYIKTNKKRIRSYEFEFKKYIHAYISDMYTKHLLYSSSVRNGTSYANMVNKYGSAFEVRMHDVIDERFCIHETDNEFQLLMLYNEHELFKEYCKAILYKEYIDSTVNVLYIGTTDSIRITNLNKALKDFIDAYKKAKY